MNKSIQVGAIKEFRYRLTEDEKGKLLEVRVLSEGRLENWLPVATQASQIMTVHIPVREGEQVILLKPFGVFFDGVVLRNVSFEKLALPLEANEDVITVDVMDGTLYRHNIKDKKISLKTPSSVDFVSEQTINVTAKKVTFDSEVEIKKNLRVGKKIFDVKGNVTDHSHKVAQHKIAKPRT